MSTSARRTLYLIDGYAQFFRAYHAIRTPMSSPVTSEPTFMTFGFMDMLLKLLREYAPDHLALVLDVSGDRGTFRSEIYPEYKANRDPPPSDLRPQVDRCLSLLEQLRVPIYGVEGVEADDVIATIVDRMQAQHPDLEIRIISKDKDLLQLLAEHVVMLNLRKNPEPDEIVDIARLREEKGILPEQVVDMLSLMGDTADNVPGVPGIGPKTASQLIGEYGSIEGIYAQIDSESEAAQSKRAIKGKRLENLLGARENIPLSRELITLRKDCEIDFDLEATKVEPSTMDAQAALESMRTLGFTRHREQLKNWFDQAQGSGIPGSLFGDAPAEPLSTPEAGDYSTVTDLQAFEGLLKALRGSSRIAVDTETEGLVAPVVPLAGICLATEVGEAFYVPVKAPDGAEILDEAMVLQRLKPILEDASIPKFGHNLKFDINVLRNHGIALRGIAGDTMVASYVVDATRSSHGMNGLAQSLLDGRQCVPITSIIGKGKSQILFSAAPLALAGPYAAEDADITLQLEDRLRPMVDSMGLRTLYEATELPLVEVLAELEFNGIRVDSGELDRQREELLKQSALLRQEVIDAAPHVFSPDSPRQLAAVLFNAPEDDPPGLGLTPIKKGKTGPSTDVEVLEKLSADPKVHTDIPEKIVEYRQLTKLINTYLVALKDAIQPSTGRIHASFNQTVTATGRLSSSGPNLQNIPIRTETGRRIRRAFIAEKGHVLLAADYSQIELRILAHLSQDTGLIDAFAAGVDIHASVAAEVFGIALEEVTSKERTVAKMVNFGIVYGITPYGLARRLGDDTPVSRAAQMIEEYKQRYPGIDGFLQACIAQAEESGYVQTILGRRRQIPEVRARNPNERALGERMAINTVVQGSAADLIKIAMITLHEELPKVLPEARMLLQIHDELVFETPEEGAEDAWGLIKPRMEGAMDLRVPLLVEGSWGGSWADTK